MTGSFPAAQGGKPRLLRVETKNKVALKQGFRQWRYKAPPCHPALTQVQGPESGRGAPPNPPVSRPHRQLPPDLHPRKLVPAEQASSAAPSNPCALERSASRAQGPPRSLPHGHRVPACLACTPPTPGLGGFSPHVPRGPGAGSADLNAGRTCRPRPDPSSAASPKSPAAAAAKPARPAPSLPPLPTAGSALHSGSRARSSLGCNSHGHFPAAPRLRVLVPRLPKHAHQAERGGREEVLAGSRSLQQGWAGGL